MREEREGGGEGNREVRIGRERREERREGGREGRIGRGGE